MNLLSHCSCWRAFLACLLLTTNALLQAQLPRSDNRNWSAIVAGTVGPIQTGAVVSGVDVSGRVSIAGIVDLGGQFVARAAKWENGNWRLLGGRIEGQFVAPTIRAIAYADNGDVYIGGQFVEAVNGDGSVVAVQNIARWSAGDGQWHSLGGGVSDDVNVIALAGNNDVYIGGNFVRSFNPDGSQVVTNRLAHWDASQDVWQPLGDGVDQPVTAMAIDANGRIIIGGDFTEAYDAPNLPVVLIASGVAAWNGSNWSPLGQGVRRSQTVFGDLVRRILIDTAGDIVLAGAIDEAVNGDGSTVAGPLVRWDGSGWSSLPGGLTIQSINDIQIDAAGTIYVHHYPGASQFYLSALNGTAWTRIAETSTFGNFATIAANKAYGAPYLYAGGAFVDFFDPANNNTVQVANNAWWTGNKWRQLQSPGASGEVYVLEIDNIARPNRFYAGGSFSSVNGVTARNIAGFDGQNWRSFGGGLNGPVHAIQVVVWPWNGVFVGGSFSQVENPDGSIVNVANLAFWDEGAQQWFDAGGFDGPVYALENFGGVILYAGGGFTSSTNGERMNAISRFNFASQTWSALQGGVIDGAASGVVRALGLNAPNYGRGHVFIHLYVGGNFNAGASSADPNQAFYQFSKNIIRWDEGGDRWVRLGSGTDDEVLTLAIPRSNIGDLWVGGRFRSAINGDFITTSEVPYAATWNGSVWEKLGRGLNGPVHAITFFNGFNNAFLGGEFTEVINSDGTVVAANHVAVFDRTRFGGVAGEWQAFASGADSTVRSLASVWSCPRGNGVTEVVYAGGEFFLAGNRAARGIAKWKYQRPFSGRGSSYAVVVSSSRSRSGQRRRTQAVRSVLPLPACNNGIGKISLPVDEVIFDNLDFRESVELPPMPYLEPFSITLYDVEDASQSIAVYDSLVVDSENPQLLVLFGVDDTTAYIPNPDSIPIGESLVLQDLAISPEPNEIPVVFFHGITDAPIIDIVTSTGDTLVVNLQYGATNTPLSLPPGSYTVDLLRSSDKQKIGTHSFTISNRDEQYSVVTLSGFLDPAANQNGPAIEMGVYEVTLTPMTTGVGEQSEVVPSGFWLEQNYPNPFNPSTTINYSVEWEQKITLTVYDLLGREVVTLVNKRQVPGEYSVSFDADGLASGVYFAMLQAGSEVFLRKMLLVR